MLGESKIRFRYYVGGLILLAVISYLLALHLHSQQKAEIADTVVDELVAQGLAQGIPTTDIKRVIQSTLVDHAHQAELQELLVHLAIALVVAVIVILLVEVSSAEETEKRVNIYIAEVARNVWSAVHRRMLPEAIAREIDEVSRSPVVKKSCSYTLTFRRIESNTDGNSMCLLRRELVYTLQNIANKKTLHNIQAIIKSEQGVQNFIADGEEAALPRHVRLEIDDVEIPLPDVIHKDEDGNPFVLRSPVVLKQGSEMKVYVCTDEAVPLQGKNSYIQATPVHGLSLFIKNEVQDLLEITSVLLQHPRGEDFVRGADSNYHFEGGILPGQSLSVFWRSRQPSQL